LTERSVGEFAMETLFVPISLLAGVAVIELG